MKKMNGIILVDNDTEEYSNDYLQTILQKSNLMVNWTVFRKVSNKPLKYVYSKMIRQIIYIIYPLGLISVVRKFDYVIAWQQFYGISLAFWFRLLGIRKSFKLTVCTFIYNPKKGVFGKLYYAYIKYCLDSGYIDHIICFSRDECNRYSKLFHVGKEMFFFVPLNITSLKNDYLNIDDDFFLSVGRSNRNNDLLVSVAKKIGIKCKIACDNYTHSSLPSNVELYHDLFGEEMIKIMARCKCVIVLLYNPDISSGQLVVLRAFSLGKPVIVTRSKGLSDDYVDDGINGIVINNTEEELIMAIEKVCDKNNYSRMCDAAFHLYKMKYSSDLMFQRIAEIAQQNSV